MTPELRAAVFALPADERRKLAEELLDSVPDGEAGPVPQWQIDELERREAFLQANPDSPLTWEQVEEYVRNRHGR